MSEPIVSYAASVIWKKSAAWLKEQVVAFESDLRLQSFLSALSLELHGDTPVTPDSVDKKLNSILKSASARESLFTAYRRVCLAASRTLGPKIIGLLTGRLLLEDRLATPLEEHFFLCAEQLSDIELSKFKTTILSKVSHEEAENYPWREIALFMGTGSTATSRAKVPALIDAARELGNWVFRLKSLGVLQDEVETKVRSLGPAAPVDGRMRTEYEYRLWLSPEYYELVRLIERAQGPISETSATDQGL